MKSLSKFLAIATLLFAFSFAANAQRGERGGKNADPTKMAERQTTQMVEKLNLDEVQASKVKELNLTYAKKMHEAQEENKGNRDAMKEIRASIDSEKNAKLKQVLTTEQFKSYEDILAKRGKKKGRKGSRQSK